MSGPEAGACSRLGSGAGDGVWTVGAGGGAVRSGGGSRPTVCRLTALIPVMKRPVDVTFGSIGGSARGAGGGETGSWIGSGFGLMGRAIAKDCVAPKPPRMGAGLGGGSGAGNTGVLNCGSGRGGRRGSAGSGSAGVDISSSGSSSSAASMTFSASGSTGADSIVSAGVSGAAGLTAKSFPTPV
jgi:hypothetical protein